ncbi:hypothetical protein [Phenylobacterium sp.]|uniref:hypothetical protein n=1 Tax=Phenylobacterium sp. TaxID=1871053 RepID=UPI0011F78485|nr:hypothetical protein [Phenylobacterium sp.]THD60311.1 MAG: hypothetical protein E8A12_10725 [Phenylobacterium sp.]
MAHLRTEPAHRLRPLALLALLGLAACDIGRASRTEILARQQALDPPQLWRVEVIGRDGAIQAAAYVCADRTLRETFTHSRAEVNGQPCEDTTYPYLRPNGWSLSCQANGRPFGVSATTVGDLQKDFRLDFVLTELYHYRTPKQPDPVTASQVRHFLRMGPCPSGWSIGDQAKPGRPPRRT